MKSVKIYTTRTCPYCMAAKDLLTQKAVEFEEVVTDDKPAIRQELLARTGQRTVPQIWIGDHHVGGCDDLFQLEREGKLNDLLL